MEKRSFAPTPLLNRYIDRYWMWRGKPGEVTTLPPMYTGTGAELFFHFKTPFSIIREPGRREQLPSTHIACPREKAVHLYSGESIGFVAVRFRSWALNNFSPVPTDKLKDQLFDATGIWNSEQINYVLETISHNCEAKNIATTLDSFLLTNLRKHEKQQENINRAVDYIYYNCQSQILRETVENSNISTRHFQRKFKEVTGVSPKSFQRSSRFQQVLKTFHLRQNPMQVREILDLGYYDQSHYIKEFKHFTDLTPTRYFEKNLSMAHFYNTSMKTNDNL